MRCRTPNGQRSLKFTDTLPGHLLSLLAGNWNIQNTDANLRPALRLGGFQAADEAWWNMRLPTSDPRTTDKVGRSIDFVLLYGDVDVVARGDCPENTKPWEGHRWVLYSIRSCISAPIMRWPKAKALCNPESRTQSTNVSNGANCGLMSSRIVAKTYSRAMLTSLGRS